MPEFTNPHVITRTCPICGKAANVTVRAADYKAWQAGVLAQDIFPYLSPDEREMLISGICPTCWGDMTADED